MIPFEQQHYCQHFKNSKLIKNFTIEKQPSCKYCLLGPQFLWMCLSKGCQNYFCDGKNYQHLKNHLQQSKKKKGFHSIFININTASIICVYCLMEIYDLDIVQSKNSIQEYQDPYPFRLKILSALSQFPKNKSIFDFHDIYIVTGQLQNSEGHKKYNQGLTGLFGDKYNHIINVGIQFIAHISFFRNLILQMKADENQLIIELKKIIANIMSADFRAISSDEIAKIFYRKRPGLYGYKRKDPFQIFSVILNTIHQSVKYIQIPSSTSFIHLQSSQQQFLKDQWDYLSQNRSTSIKSPINDCVSTQLALNYYCNQCNKEISSIFRIDFIKLHIPKKRKKVKQIQKELKQHNIQSPIKKRGRSLVNIFIPSQEVCPITIPQLLIQFLNHPFAQKKKCQKCDTFMKQKKSHFQRLPQVLLLVINRMNRDGNTIDQTQISLETNKEIDLSKFCLGYSNGSYSNLSNLDKQRQKQPLIYQFQTAVCIEKKCVFPVVVKHILNKQNYVFKNQIVQINKGALNLNPYLICLKRKPNQNQEALYKNIASSVSCGVNPDYALPDFWLLKYQTGRQMRLDHQLVCIHNYLKSNCCSKMQNQQKIPKEVYQALLEKFGGKMYFNQICKICQNNLQTLKKRKQLQKQIIIQYDKLKTNLNCMVSAKWIKKWRDFLYNKKSSLLYIAKGFPQPGPIDNKQILEDGVCRPNMKKNQDYNVVNIFIWRFLKQLYGGGPQIRYKWNQKPLNKFDQQFIHTVKLKAQQIKEKFKNNQLSPSKKKSELQGQSIIQQFQQEDDIQIPDQ